LRVLITGASGFAGQWLTRACAQDGDEVLGISRSGALSDGSGRGIALDLRDADAVAKLVSTEQPEVIYHLAALSHVGRSWSDPGETLTANVVGASSLLEAVRKHAADARVVWASSCEVYGTVEQLPVTEQAPLRPRNPYAVSKATGDMLAELYADAHGLSIVRARPFNHAGPGQLPIFIVSSLARQAAAARHSGARSLELVTGNPDTRRDFTDVRDVVAAYRLLSSPTVAPAAYNVATGVSVSAAEQVQLVASLLDGLEVHHTVDRASIRANEVMDHRGSHAALTQATGWQPVIPLRQTMLDTIAWWERELATDPVAG
jgi:GDP-4-dehydro-6-deoxy-D-mannose reductase